MKAQLKTGLRMLLALALFRSTLALMQQKVLMGDVEKLKVAGSNPFYYCNDPDQYTLQIAYIDITPPDPVEWRPLQNITIEIDGHNQQIIEDEAEVDISIMQGSPDGDWRRVASKRLDICKVLKTLFDEDCPVRSGVSTEIRNFTIPPNIRQGTYHLVIDGHTRFEERITCVHALIPFMVSS
ncbi:hypothetical protein GQ53DRAFT_843815 [Thozetella sp. PMI_491]|nr:hypothetical protein GQ53DRAFT_843815 [Thozetella sp. PMI_491]